MKIDYFDIGCRIKAIRVRQSITQQTLAELAGMSITHVSNIENGHTKASVAALISIANALNASTDEILSNHIRQAKDIVINSISDELIDCDERELKVIEETVKTIKQTLRKAYASE